MGHEAAARIGGASLTGDDHAVGPLRPRSKTSSLCLWSFVVLTAAACHTTKQPHASEELESDPRILAAHDPDPDNDKGPEFCNPAGKAGAALQACHAHNDAIYKEFENDAKAREPWFNFPPDSWADSKEVPTAHIVTVPAGPNSEAAVERLAKEAIIELDNDSAAKMAGRPAPAGVTGQRPFLLRGLVYLRENGSFRVYEKGQAVLVRHDSSGDPTTTESRAPIIVYLPFKPSELFVDCQIGD